MLLRLEYQPWHMLRFVLKDGYPSTNVIFLSVMFSKTYAYNKMNTIYRSKFTVTQVKNNFDLYCKRWNAVG